MRIIILAAGQGKRMKSDGPKVLAPLFGQPMIGHLLDEIKKTKIDAKPIVVVGYQQDKVRAALQDYQVEFAVQEQQLGTAHAVLACQNLLNPQDDILVLYGDQPKVSATALEQLTATFAAAKPTIAMITYHVPDFTVFAHTFVGFGRIIRDSNQQIMAIREAKELQGVEKDIAEINPAYYAFAGAWLWANLAQLANNNSQGEYYLTDLVQLAFQQGKKVVGITRQNLEEAVGFNTQESLKSFENLSRLNI